MSNDLISRKALLEALSKTEKECEEVMCVPSWATALEVIRSQPTAYDADKVVEELEEAGAIIIEMGDSELCAELQRTIEIVKEGLK